MLDRSLAAAMGVGAVALIVLSLVAANAMQQAGADSALLLKADAGVRAAGEADMMHEGLRQSGVFGCLQPNDIAENITGVARSASDTTAAASSTSEAADELARMAAELQGLVGEFA